MTPEERADLSATPSTHSASETTREPGQTPQTATSQAPAAEALSPWSEETRKKLSVLNDVLASRNDNDPRLDQVLKGLSTESKQALRERYKALPSKDRNGRGTVVFLIGRELESSEDAAFLADVLAEAPCLSLGDCSKDAPIGRGEEAHSDEAVGVTLSYPQIVSLVSIERLLEKNQGKIPPALRDGIARAIRNAENSPVPSVAQRAHRLSSRL